MNSHQLTKLDLGKLLIAVNGGQVEEALKLINNRTINLILDPETKETTLVKVAGEKPDLTILSHILTEQPCFDPNQHSQMSAAIRHSMLRYMAAEEDETRLVYRNILVQLLGHGIFHSPLTTCKLNSLDSYLVHYRHVDFKKHPILCLYQLIYQYSSSIQNRQRNTYKTQQVIKLSRQIEISGYFSALTYDAAASNWYTMGMDTALELIQSEVILDNSYYLQVLKKIVFLQQNRQTHSQASLVTPLNAYSAALMIAKSYLKYHQQSHADVTDLKYFAIAYQIATDNALTNLGVSFEFLKVFVDNNFYSHFIEPNNENMGISRILENVVKLKDIMPYPCIEASLFLQYLLRLKILSVDLLAFFLTEINEKHINNRAVEQLTHYESEVLAMVQLYGLDYQINYTRAFSMYKEIGDQAIRSNPYRSFHAYSMSMLVLNKTILNASTYQQDILINYAKQISEAIESIYKPDYSVLCIIEVLKILFDLCKLIDAIKTPTASNDKYAILHIIQKLFVKVIKTYSDLDQIIPFARFASFMYDQMISSGLLVKRFNSELYVESLSACIKHVNNMNHSLYLFRQLTQLCDYAISHQKSSLEFHVKKIYIELLVAHEKLKHSVDYADVSKAVNYLDSLVEFSVSVDKPIEIKNYLSLFHMKGVLSLDDNERYQAFSQAINLGCAKSIINIIQMKNLLATDNLIELMDKALKNSLLPINILHNKAITAIALCLQNDRDRFIHNSIGIHAFARFELRVYLAHQFVQGHLSLLAVKHNYLPAFILMSRAEGKKLSNQSLYLSIRILAELTLHGDLLVNKFGLNENYLKGCIDEQLEFLNKARVDDDKSYIDLSAWYLSFHQHMQKLLVQKKESYANISAKMPNFNVDTLLLQADKEVKIDKALRSGMLHALHVNNSYLDRLTNKTLSSVERAQLSHAEVRSLLPKGSITEAIIEKNKSQSSDYDPDSFTYELQQSISCIPQTFFAHAHNEEKPDQDVSFSRQHQSDHNINGM